MSTEFTTTVEHDKTGNIYIVLNKHVEDCSDSSKNKPMVLYRNLEGKQFVREIAEFYQRFTPVDNSDIKHIRR